MARPIKETPILKGKDAIKFLKLMDENKYKKVSKEEIERIKQSAAILNNIAQF